RLAEALPPEPARPAPPATPLVASSAPTQSVPGAVASGLATTGAAAAGASILERGFKQQLEIRARQLDMLRDGNAPAAVGDLQTLARSGTERPAPSATA